MTDRKPSTRDEDNIVPEDEVEVLEDVQHTAEETDIVDDEATSLDKIKDLKKQLETIKEEKRQAQEETQRAKADFLNSKKRLEEDLQLKIHREREAVLQDLLPICDSFQMAMQNEEQWKKVDAVWRNGVEGIYAQLRSVLDSYQVDQLDPLGNQFNPEQHEAVDEVPADDTYAHNTVAKVIQSGYRRKGADGTERILRPARVVVATDRLKD